MIICVTGHRPDKLGGYTGMASETLVIIAARWLQINKPTKVYIGMALGWDQAVAEACHSLGIPFIACLPFQAQASMWSIKQQEHYTWLLVRAESIIVVSKGGYTTKKMQVRNEYMVDKTESVLAMFDGSEGGTYNCVHYAAKKGKPVVNLYNKYKEATS